MRAHSVLKYIGLTKNFICFFIHVCGKLKELFGQPSTSWNMNKHKLWRDGVILIHRYKKSLSMLQRVHKRTAYVPLAYSPFSWKTASLIAHQQSPSFSSGQKMDCFFPVMTDLCGGSRSTIVSHIHLAQGREEDAFYFCIISDMRQYYLQLYD